MISIVLALFVSSCLGLESLPDKTVDTRAANDIFFQIRECVQRKNSDDKAVRKCIQNYFVATVGIYESNVYLSILLPPFRISPLKLCRSVPIRNSQFCFEVVDDQNNKRMGTASFEVEKGKLKVREITVR